MVTKTVDNNEESSVDKLEKVGLEAKKIIDSLAKGLGVAASELWGIFVRQYVVKGLNELFTALVLFTSAWFLKDYISFWALVPVAFGIGLIYGAISYLGNPKYFALNDIVERVRDFKDGKKIRL